MGTITFNNVTSKDLGVEVETFPDYVAPEKEYQVTHVPGRNGDLVVDTKTYKNVPRSYKVSMAVEPPAVSVSGSTASFEATAERALAECKTVISSDVGKVGTTIINSTTDPVENNEPYNFRAIPNGVGDRENDTLIGGSVAWNQNVKTTDFKSKTENDITGTNNGDGSYTVNGTATGTFDCYKQYPYIENHIYLLCGCPKNGSANTYYLYWRGYKDIGNGILLKANVTGSSTIDIIVASGVTVNNLKFIPQFIDLTQMFGSTIADYIYGLETATAGAGVAWFRNLFPKDYYPYNAGELISVKTEAHKTVGFNQWDEDYSLGFWNANGSFISNTSGYFSSKTHIKVLPNTTYCFREKDNISFYLCFYDVNKNFIRCNTCAYPSQRLFTTPDNCYYINFSTFQQYGTTYKHDICVNLSDTSKNGTYEPYEEHIYPLNPALELRGIPKLNSSNKLYYDGDIYSSDGSIIRKYGIVDLGTLDWSKATFQNNNWRFSCSLPSDFRQPTTAAEHANFVCSKYSYSNSPINGTTGFGASLYVNNSGFYVMDMNYSDATAFKTAMSGVYLIYELATPVIESTTGLIDNVPIASFDDGADNEPVNSLVVDITATESGSGEKSPDNPYTISGFDNGIIGVYGTKNLFGGSLDGTLFPTKVLSGTQLTASMKSNSGASFRLNLYRADQTLLDFWAVSESTGYKRTFTATEDIFYFAITNVNGTVEEVQIEKGSTATPYEAYNGNTYTFAFGQTVYGGHFDNKGNLVVTHGTVDLGSLNWSDDALHISGIVSDMVDGNYSSDLSSYSCEQFVAKNRYDAWASMVDGEFGTNHKAIRCKWSPSSTGAEFKTLVTGCKFVYPLATPITLSITSQGIPTLLGENNIFSNTGNIKSLSYPKQVCPFEPAQEVDDHGTEEYVDNREVAIPVGHESKYFTAGKIYNFSWLDEAGLIKEGELNADTGVLTITNGYGIVDLGDLTWTLSSSTAEYFSTPKSAINEGMVALSCSVYKVYATDQSLDKSLFQTSSSIRIRDSSLFRSVSSSVVDPTFKSAMHGVKLLYELADSVRTIQLTPVQVESLIGHNVLISESGNISVTPRTYSTYTEKMNAISDWLHSASGYARLEDTYEPDYYRKAYYDEQTDMENIFNEAGQATLNFICKPQRYLKSGEEPITISSGGLIQNRTRYEAYPILKVTTNNTQGSVAIGNHSITIKAGAGTDPITIDCELQDAWSGTSNKNSYIVLTDGEFPVIDPGTQTVTFNGGIQSVEVIPRWWTV